MEKIKSLGTYSFSLPDGSFKPMPIKPRPIIKNKAPKLFFTKFIKSLIVAPPLVIDPSALVKEYLYA